MKTKLSVTVDAALVQELDAAAEGSSRSRVVEEALTHWLRKVRGRRLETDIERYYLRLSEEELAEDEAWAELGHAATGETWS